MIYILFLLLFSYQIFTMEFSECESDTVYQGELARDASRMAENILDFNYEDEQYAIWARHINNPQRKYPHIACLKSKHNNTDYWFQREEEGARKLFFETLTLCYLYPKNFNFTETETYWHMQTAILPEHIFYKNLHELTIFKDKTSITLNIYEGTNKEKILESYHITPKNHEVADSLLKMMPRLKMNQIIYH